MWPWVWSLLICILLGNQKEKCWLYNTWMWSVLWESCRRQPWNVLESNTPNFMNWKHPFFFFFFFGKMLLPGEKDGSSHINVQTVSQWQWQGHNFWPNLEIFHESIFTYNHFLTSSGGWPLILQGIIVINVFLSTTISKTNSYDFFFNEHAYYNDLPWK